MVGTYAPFGLLPVYHPSGLDRPTRYEGVIASGYGTVFYQNQPVQLTAAGTIIPSGTAGTALMGVFAGVEYDNSTGHFNTNTWVASTTGSNIEVYIWDDPHIVYKVTSVGTVGTASIGGQLNGTSTALGTSTTGISTMAVLNTTVGAGNQGQYRIVGVAKDVNNGWGDTYTVLLVQIAANQFWGSVTAVL